MELLSKHIGSPFKCNGSLEKIAAHCLVKVDERRFVPSYEPGSDIAEYNQKLAVVISNSFGKINQELDLFDEVEVIYSCFKVPQSSTHIINRKLLISHDLRLTSMVRNLMVLGYHLSAKKDNGPFKDWHGRPYISGTRWTGPHCLLDFMAKKFCLATKHLINQRDAFHDINYFNLLFPTDERLFTYFYLDLTELFVLFHETAHIVYQSTCNKAGIELTHTKTDVWAEEVIVDRLAYNSLFWHLEMMAEMPRYKIYLAMTRSFQEGNSEKESTLLSCTEIMSIVAINFFYAVFLYQEMLCQKFKITPINVNHPPAWFRLSSLGIPDVFWNYHFLRGGDFKPFNCFAAIFDTALAENRSQRSSFFGKSSGRVQGYKGSHSDPSILLEHSVMEMTNKMTGIYIEKRLSELQKISKIWSYIDAPNMLKFNNVPFINGLFKRKLKNE